MAHSATIAVVPLADATFTRPRRDAEAEAALDCAAASARRFLVSRRQFRAAVTSVEAHVETYQRALHRFERRTLSLQTAAGGDRRHTQPTPDPDFVDPWGVNPATVESDTRVSAICPECDGAMRVTCSVCDGSTRARCTNCNGSGQVYSRQKNRLYKNCPRCRGAGTQKCTDCRGGFVACERCGATGVVTAWLALERVMLTQVRIFPRNAGAAVHVGIENAENFDARQFANALVADTGTQAQLPPTPAELHPDVNGRTDRVVSSRLQSFSAKVHRIVFATSLCGGLVETAGSPPSVAATSDWSGLRWRRTTIFATLVATASMALALRYWYSARHDWYAQFGDGNFVLATALATAIAATLLSAVISTATRVRSSIALFTLAAVTLLSVVTTGFAIAHSHPTATTARAALARLAFDDARAEAQAMIDLELDRADGEQILDELQSRKLAAATTCQEVATLADYGWHASLAQQRAQAQLRDCATRAAATAFAAGDDAALARLTTDVAKLARSETAGTRWLSAALSVPRSLARDDLDAAVTSLATIGDIAGDVPTAMRPSSYQSIVDGAATLRQSLTTSQSGSGHTTRQALKAAIDQANAFAALVPSRGADVTKPLKARLDKLRRQAARAEHKAEQEADDGQLLTPQLSDDEKKEPKSDVLNPY